VGQSSGSNNHWRPGPNEANIFGMGLDRKTPAVKESCFGVGVGALTGDDPKGLIP